MYRPPRPRRSSPPVAPPPAVPPRRSDAAAYVAVAVLLVGLYLGKFTVLAPAFLGFSLLLTVGTFLSTRLNPLSVGFYLTTKPSWTAIGVVFVVSLALLGAAYYYFVHGIAPILPGLSPKGL
jgi:hypothetical protein